METFLKLLEAKVDRARVLLDHNLAKDEKSYLSITDNIVYYGIGFTINLNINNKHEHIQFCKAMYAIDGFSLFLHTTDERLHTFISNLEDEDEYRWCNYVNRSNPVILALLISYFTNDELSNYITDFDVDCRKHSSSIKGIITNDTIKYSEFESSHTIDRYSVQCTDYSESYSDKFRGNIIKDTSEINSELFGYITEFKALLFTEEVKLHSTGCLSRKVIDLEKTDKSILLHVKYTDNPVGMKLIFEMSSMESESFKVTNQQILPEFSLDRDKKNLIIDSMFPFIIQNLHKEEENIVAFVDVHTDGYISYPYR